MYSVNKSEIKNDLKNKVYGKIGPKLNLVIYHW